MIIRIVDNGMMLEYDPVKFFNENDLNPEDKLDELRACQFEDKVQFIIDNVDPEINEIKAWHSCRFLIPWLHDNEKER